MRALIILALAALAASSFPSSAGADPRYDREGAYLDYAQRPSLLSGFAPMADYEIDPDGRGVIEILPGGRRIRASVTDALHGLWHWTRFVRTGRRRHLLEAERAARWIRRKQDTRTGRYLVPYSYDLGADSSGGNRLVLRRRWFGANSQGMAISLLTRLYRATGKRSYLRQARRALRPFERPMTRGGVVSRFLGGRRPFYEGYATLPVPVHTLVHHLYALVGLYDLSDLSPRARRLFLEGVRTLPVALPHYRGSDGRTAAWLAHITAAPRPFAPLLGFYQEQQLSLLRALSSVRPGLRLRPHLTWMTEQLVAICRDPAEFCFFAHPSR